jgi:hypothetical protein
MDEKGGDLEKETDVASLELNGEDEDDLVASIPPTEPTSAVQNNENSQEPHSQQNRGPWTTDSLAKRIGLKDNHMHVRLPLPLSLCPFLSYIMCIVLCVYCFFSSPNGTSSTSL